MILWKLTIEIEAENYITKRDILSKIDLEINKGEGLYAIVDKAKVDLIKDIPEDDL